MATTDTLLALDMSISDCYYRIRRVSAEWDKVVYVHVQDLDVLAQGCNTYGPDVIRELSKRVDCWNDEWETLTVSLEDGTVCALQNEWQRRFIPLHVIVEDAPRLSVLDLHIEQHLKNRVYRIRRGTELEILKICPFDHQTQYMTRELTAYKQLRERGCTLVPTIRAYVYEGTEEQIIGFVCDELNGSFAKSSDLNVCKNALRQLHSFGVVHGDLNTYNIIITTNGPRFFDLEMVVLDCDDNVTKEQFQQLQQRESDHLEEALHNEGDWGKPWLQ